MPLDLLIAPLILNLLFKRKDGIKYIFIHLTVSSSSLHFNLLALGFNRTKHGFGFLAKIGRTAAAAAAGKAKTHYSINC